ncbi:hypothetical protein K7432_012088 [Basidiobolus ranarum]|uniref:Uncharacterized protein n=1 Tax=Basidiobolus ranarum TaxID=34480 RepID=A0ABR2VST9_9FUNG
MKVSALKTFLIISTLTLTAGVSIPDPKLSHQYCQGVVSGLQTYGISLDVKACKNIDVTKFPTGTTQPNMQDCKALVKSANDLGLKCDEKDCPQAPQDAIEGDGDDSIDKGGYGTGVGSDNEYSEGMNDKGGRRKGSYDKDSGEKGSKGYNSKGGYGTGIGGSKGDGGKGGYDAGVDGGKDNDNGKGGYDTGVSGGKDNGGKGGKGDNGKGGYDTGVATILA